MIDGKFGNDKFDVNPEFSEPDLKGLISVNEKLPDIEEAVFIVFGDTFYPDHARIETGRRVQTNQNGDWGWYGYASNTMHIDVTHFFYMPDLSTITKQ